MLGYILIDPKVCQKGSFGRRKSQKNNILEDIMLIWWFGSHWLASICNACMKEPINKVDFFFLVRTNSHCKGEVVVQVQQKFPLFYLYFYPCPITLWTSLQLENTSTIEMNTDWKSLHFHGPEQAIKLAKK